MNYVGVRQFGDESLVVGDPFVPPNVDKVNVRHMSVTYITAVGGSDSVLGEEYTNTCSITHDRVPAINDDTIEGQIHV